MAAPWPDPLSEGEDRHGHTVMLKRGEGQEGMCRVEGQLGESPRQMGEPVQG